jgi:hypothetical protein
MLGDLQSTGDEVETRLLLLLLLLHPYKCMHLIADKVPDRLRGNATMRLTRSRC